MPSGTLPSTTAQSRDSAETPVIAMEEQSTWVQKLFVMLA